MARVRVAAVLEVTVDQVWERVRDFNSLPRWHPLVATSRIEQDLPGTTVGCVRNFQLKDGGQTLREKLLALSDVDRSCSYSILESPLPVRDYQATLRFWDVSDREQTFAHWQADFAVDQQREAETVELIRGIFRDGLRGLELALKTVS